MIIVGLDFESWYSSEYSLSTMPTHAYIRDDRWRCLGCGFQFGDEAPFYVEDPAPVLRKIDAYGWERVTLVAHNASFDGSVLWERFGKRRPGMWLDTSLIARWMIAMGKLPPEQGAGLPALAPLVGMRKGNTWDAVHGGGQGLADYGTEDVRIMMALLRLFMKHEPPADELMYMDMHIRMQTEPQLITDPDLLAEAALITPQQERLGQILRKDANMVRLLEAHGIDVEYKTTPKGKRKPALAKTDRFMQELLAHPDPDVAELASLRKDAGSNLTRTRALTLQRVGNPLPFPVLYYGAHTGRGSGAGSSDEGRSAGGYNMQNMPAGGILRRAISAPNGGKLVVGDSGQIEARTVGWRAGDERLLEVFRQSDADPNPARDAYRRFGGQYMYHLKPEDLTNEQRQISKAGLLGLGFGQGWRGLINSARSKAGLIIPEDDARRAVKAYREGFKRVPQWWRRLMRWAREDGYIELPDGRRITYPDLREEDVEDAEGNVSREFVFDRPVIFSKGPRGKRQTVKVWHGLVCENDTQATARSVVFWQALQMRKDGVPVLGMSHDEVISHAASEAEATDVAECMNYWFRQVPPWAEGLPTRGGVNIGDNYAECK